jgi:putative Holliday junction resolvase
MVVSPAVRILGLDLGDQTIGVAVSDEMGWTAQSLDTIRRASLREDFRALEVFVERYRPEKIVLGLPRNMNGTIGAQAEKVLRFAERLSSRFDIPVLTWDERLSTVGAEKYLLEAEMSGRKRRKVIDKLAAAFILQGYLDSSGHTVDPSGQGPAAE